MSNLSKLYYVNLGKEGTFKPSGNPLFDTTPDDTDAIFNHLKANNINNLVLNFHGGLISTSAGIKGADEFKQTMGGNHIHPVSFVWETGPLETIIQNVGTIYNTKLFQKILEKALKVGGGIAGLELLGSRGFKNLTTEEIRIELQKDRPFDSYNVNKSSRSANISNTNNHYLLDEIQMEMEIEMNEDPQVNSSLINELTSEEADLINMDKVAGITTPGSRGIFTLYKTIQAAVKITFRVVRRVAEGRDHQAYPTIIEEIARELLVADAGVWLWGGMKKKAEMMWKPDSAGTGTLDQHAGNYFLIKLRDYCIKYPEVKVDLVGHSAGCIAICEMIKEMAKRNINEIPIRHILFLAPACRCDLFSEAIIDNANRFSSFRMFTMKDELELEDLCLKVVYTNSLLYLISGILEKDEYDAYILGMQRYLLDKHPYSNNPLLEKVMDFINGGTDRAVYSKTEGGALDGLITDCISHGGFNDFNKPTMNSIAHILNN